MEILFRNIKKQTAHFEAAYLNEKPEDVGAVQHLIKFIKTDKIRRKYGKRSYNKVIGRRVPGIKRIPTRDSINKTQVFVIIDLLNAAKDLCLGQRQVKRFGYTHWL